MQFHRLTLANYRVHKALTVEFGEAMTLVGGPNEAGKSTLVEALHRVLFLPHKKGGALQESMVSTTHGGAPEVELVFSLGPQRYTLKKVFQGGAKSSAVLTPAGGQALQGDAAEEKLQALLGQEAFTGTTEDRLRAVWPHLWVWQGDSTTDPALAAASQAETLTRRLQAEGAGAVVTSDLDGAVAARVAERYAGQFTQAGKAKVGSDLERALAKHQEAEEALAEAEAAFAALENQLAAIRDAERVVAETEAARAQATADLAQVRDHLARAAGLETERTLAGEHLAKATEQLARLRAQDATIRQLEAQRGEVVAQAERLAATAKQAEAELAAHKQGVAAAEAGRTRAGRAALAAQSRRDGFGLSLQRLELEAELAAWEPKNALATELAAKLSGLRQALAGLSAPTQAQLKQLRAAHADAAQAAARLEATGVRVELLDEVQGWRLGGEPLARGKPTVLTNTSVLEVGGRPALSIAPGGGASLEDARRQAADTQRALATLFAQLGLGSLAQAEAQAEQREALERQGSETQAQLSGLDPAALAKRGESLKVQLIQVRAQLASLQGFAPPATPKDAQEGLGKATEELGQAQQELASLEAQVKTLRDLETRAQAAKDDAAAQVGRVAAKTSELDGDLARCRQEAGEAAPRQAQLDALAVAARQASERHEQLKAQLDAVGADALRRTEARLLASLAQMEQTLADRRVASGTARALVAAQMGVKDPAAVVDAQREAETQAAEALRLAQTRSSALALLNTLFVAKQTEIAQKLNAPLESRMNDYLKSLFGNPRVQLRVGGQGLQTDLSLARGAQGQGSFAFSQLSAGAREQVAAAARLAMAELLAQDFDGKLPIVFDDAFTNSDPERTRRLHDMLFQASTRGVQVIVLTCNPTEYAPLGALRVDLARS